MRLSFVSIAAVAAMSGNVLAQGWFDPPGKSFDLYTNNSNDGYSGSRGVLFTMNDPVGANAYWWTNDMPGDVGLTWELRENGNVVDTQFSNTNTGGYADYTVAGSGYLMTPGNNYELSISYQANANSNYFYAYDPNVFGDPPFNVGDIKVYDGSAGHDGGNFVMPRMGIFGVPTPGAAALLGLGGIAAARRRR